MFSRAFRQGARHAGRLAGVNIGILESKNLSSVKNFPILRILQTRRPIAS